MSVRDIAPVVCYLCHEGCEDNGSIIEVRKRERERDREVERERGGRGERGREGRIETKGT